MDFARVLRSYNKNSKQPWSETGFRSQKECDLHLLPETNDPTKNRMREQKGKDTTANTRYNAETRRYECCSIAGKNHFNYACFGRRLLS